MNKGRGHVFDDPKVLNEMLELRKSGWTLTALGRKFGVDHTSIMYQIRKNLQDYVKLPKRNYTCICGIKIFHPGRCRKCYLLSRKPTSHNSRLSPPIVPLRKVVGNKEETEFVDGTIEKINLGHDYQWYLKQQKSKLDILLRA